MDQIPGMLNLNTLRKSPDEIKAALDGNMSESHRITLVTGLEHMDCLNRLIAKLRNYLKEKVEAIHHDALLFLQTIPGKSRGFGRRDSDRTGRREYGRIRQSSSIGIMAGSMHRPTMNPPGSENTDIEEKRTIIHEGYFVNARQPQSKPEERRSNRNSRH